MRNRTRPGIAAVIASVGLVLSAGHARAADSALDSIIGDKTLRCGVMLDSPPAGFRDTNNEPQGFDVDTCRDMAQALGVAPVIVETPSPDRIPALVSNRIDVLIASTTPTAARALTVAFTQPYINNLTVVVTRRNAEISRFDDLKSRKLGGVSGTAPEQLFERKIAGDWKGSGASYTGYATDSEAYLALQQGKVDAILLSMGVFNALKQSGQFPEFVLAGTAPLSDFGSIAVRRDDIQFLNWARLFVFQQVSSGRFAELYRKYYGDGPLPPLTADGVSF